VAEGPEGEVRTLTPAEQLETVRDQCQGLLSEAAEMRAFEPPVRGAGADELADRLQRARAQLDRMESLLVMAMTLRDALVVEARRLEQAADDAWDDEARKNRGRAGEYEGAQERYAVWRFKCRTLREAARTIREAADWAASAERRIDRMYRGLDSSRLDLHKRIGAMAYETHLERA
jgi:hypothetical protein